MSTQKLGNATDDFDGATWAASRVMQTSMLTDADGVYERDVARLM
jgi:hypothetical protein